MCKVPASYCGIGDGYVIGMRECTAAGLVTSGCEPWGFAYVHGGTCYCFIIELSLVVFGGFDNCDTIRRCGDGEKRGRE